MKRVVAYFLCFISILTLSGCTKTLNGEDDLQNQPAKRAIITQLSYGGGIKVVAKRPYVRRGEVGVLAIQCTPNVNCKIVARYRIDGKNYTAIRNIVSGKDGDVLCTWKVESNTDTGTYEIEITSGGSRLVTSYVVQ